MVSSDLVSPVHIYKWDDIKKPRYEVEITDRRILAPGKKLLHIQMLFLWPSSGFLRFLNVFFQPTEHTLNGFIDYSDPFVLSYVVFSSPIRTPSMNSTKSWILAVYYHSNHHHHHHHQKPLLFIWSHITSITWDALFIVLF